MKFSKMDYVRRISNSTPVQLVVINYELTLGYIEDAKQNLLDANEDDFGKNIQRAQKALQELMSSLDLSHNLSWDLMSLYLFANKLLAQAVASRETEHLDSAHKILTNLLIGWQEVEKNNVQAPPSIANSQQVYAGLTYGRGGLNEFVMEDMNAGRGFKA